MLLCSFPEPVPVESRYVYQQRTGPDLDYLRSLSYTYTKKCPSPSHARSCDARYMRGFILGCATPCMYIECHQCDVTCNLAPTYRCIPVGSESFKFCRDTLSGRPKIK